MRVVKFTFLSSVQVSKYVSYKTHKMSIMAVVFQVSRDCDIFLCETQVRRQGGDSRIFLLSLVFVLSRFQRHLETRTATHHKTEVSWYCEIFVLLHV